MALYAIGDVQGCFDELLALLAAIRFDPAKDTLWFTGDLVNRGPKSLEVLRFVKGLGPRAVTVLGNHDLHLLALWLGEESHFHPNDTLAPLLAAPDRDELLEWLARRPLLHHDQASGWTLIHAGLPPQWDLATARRLASEVEAVLRGPALREFAARMYGNHPDHWAEGLQGWDRLRFAVNCFTRLRYCTPEGRLALAPKGAPDTVGGNLVPWFRAHGRRSRDARIIFGHWSTLGYYRGDGVCAIDSGCLWGGALTALRLDGETLTPTHLPCPGALAPGG